MNDNGPNPIFEFLKNFWALLVPLVAFSAMAPFGHADIALVLGISFWLTLAAMKGIKDYLMNMWMGPWKKGFIFIMVLFVAGTGATVYFKDGANVGSKSWQGTKLLASGLWAPISASLSEGQRVIEVLTVHEAEQAEEEAQAHRVMRTQNEWAQRRALLEHHQKKVAYSGNSDTDYSNVGAPMDDLPPLQIPGGSHHDEHRYNRRSAKRCASDDLRWVVQPGHSMINVVKGSKCGLSHFTRRNPRSVFKTGLDHLKPGDVLCYSCDNAQPQKFKNPPDSLAAW